MCIALREARSSRAAAMKPAIEATNNEAPIASKGYNASTPGRDVSETVATDVFEFLVGCAFTNSGDAVRMRTAMTDSSGGRTGIERRGISLLHAALG